MMSQPINFDAEDRGLPDSYDSVADYAVGSKRFFEAVDCERRLGLAPNLLPHIFLSLMTGKLPDLMGRGFIDAMASAALAGTIPEPISDELVESALSGAHFVLNAEDVRLGESLARRSLAHARKEHSALIVSYSLAQAAAGRFGSGAAGYVWAICHAARNGASN